MALPQCPVAGKTQWGGLAAATALITAMAGCQVEDYNLNDIPTDSLYVTTGVSAPVGSSTITLNDLIKKAEIDGLETDEAGLLVFRYDTTYKFSLASVELDKIDQTSKLSA